MWAHHHNKTVTFFSSRDGFQRQNSWAEWFPALWMRLCCWLHWEFRKKTRRNQKDAAVSVCKVTCKGFPSVDLCCPSLAKYVEMNQVKLQASFCPKRLPCVLSFCNLDGRQDKSEILLLTIFVLIDQSLHHSHCHCFIAVGWGLQKAAKLYYGIARSAFWWMGVKANLFTAPNSSWSNNVRVWVEEGLGQQFVPFVNQN